ncbi:OLC1v1015822C1 [Oldenlandia corymbosa var. corymbosa]|uniref:OLC1v1015822C1 n=1 Tax=Oldenlandia corymbosa var. corymbosa TaxID=529605 RepID=A0AAV1E666_OLDCO|nr:OLC1v1015822C1 [Oldenlandia corymbosa var. corymbosa]
MDNPIQTLRGQGRPNEFDPREDRMIDGNFCGLLEDEAMNEVVALGSTFQSNIGDASKIDRLNLGENSKKLGSGWKTGNRQEEELNQLVAEIESFTSKKSRSGKLKQVVTPNDGCVADPIERFSDGSLNGAIQDAAKPWVWVNNTRRQLQWSDRVENQSEVKDWANFDLEKKRPPTGKLNFVPPKIQDEMKISKIKAEDVRWGRFGIDKVILLPSGLFVVCFSTLQAREEVLRINIHQFGSKPLIVKPWNVKMGLNYREVYRVPVWVQMHGLELKFLNLSSLSILAKCLGAPLLADEYTRAKTRVQYARLLREMEISDSVPDKVVFEDEKGQARIQKVVYKWLPVRCAKCQGYGHASDSWRKELNEVVKKPRIIQSAWRKVAKERVVVDQTGTAEVIVATKESSVEVLPRVKPRKELVLVNHHRNTGNTVDKRKEIEFKTRVTNITPDTKVVVASMSPQGITKKTTNVLGDISHTVKPGGIGRGIVVDPGPCHHV